ncbi:MAG: hypothetical protein ABEJ35_06125 [Halobacteriaceae archaeon]
MSDEQGPGEEDSIDEESIGGEADVVNPRGLDKDAQQRLQVAQHALEGHWEDVISDMEATAEEFEERGWTADWTRPGDVSIIPDEEYGEDTAVFVVTVPGEAYETAGEFVEGDLSVDQTEIYRAATDEAVFLVVCLLDETAERAFLFPMYYSLLEWFPTYAEGTVYTRIRHIDGRYWEFGHEDPELFAPPEPEEDEEPEDPPEGPPEGVGEAPEPPMEGPKYDDLSELTPEELSEIPMEELRAYQPSDFAELNEEQLAALNVPRGNPKANDEN